MRLSLQSLAICLVSTQARVALASPCKPLTTTALAATTTTTAIIDSSTTTVAGETITNAVSDLSTTLTLIEGSTTTALGEESTTTTLAQETTTTAITAEPTTTTFEATTTTTEALEGTQMSAVLADNTKKDVYIDRWGGGYSTPQQGGSPSKARFELEPDTNRLFTYLIDDRKVYLFTTIPGGSNYPFEFDETINIDPYPNTYHYVKCEPDTNSVLSCESESGLTPIVWYWDESESRYYGNSDPDYDQHPLVNFKLG
ncbi:hypothetical protein FGADI_9549 [Fusarium gaditjirri]|uniref:Uncharacterized protein n=1 Tax=Fusarium gaditjirri TaxID=282569 RepID=A0A8H4SZS8_9HYPO|nr:hypothetical protein FGADI_9549 [Fusarium gaditjirri]